MTVYLRGGDDTGELIEIKIQLRCSRQFCKRFPDMVMRVCATSTDTGHSHDWRCHIIIFIDYRKVSKKRRKIECSWYSSLGEPTAALVTTNVMRLKMCLRMYLISVTWCLNRSFCNACRCRRVKEFLISHTKKVEDQFWEIDFIVDDVLSGERNKIIYQFHRYRYYHNYFSLIHQSLHNNWEFSFAISTYTLIKIVFS